MVLSYTILEIVGKGKPRSWGRKKKPLRWKIFYVQDTFPPPHTLPVSSAIF